LTYTIEPDEVLGLRALVELDRAATGGDIDADAGAVSKAKVLLRTALAEKLETAGLPWAPSGETARTRVAETAARGSATHGFWGTEIARKRAAYVAAAALAIVLWGGYIQGWQWTGLQENGQVWDWLNLLLLPVVLGTIPLWIPCRMDRDGDRRLRSGVELDGLCREHPMELARDAPAAGVPNHPASAIAHMGLGQCGRTCQRGTRQLWPRPARPPTRDRP
jgi:hypothetical protein